MTTPCLYSQGALYRGSLCIVPSCFLAVHIVLWDGITFPMCTLSKVPHPYSDDSDVEFLSPKMRFFLVQVVLGAAYILTGENNCTSTCPPYTYRSDNTTCTPCPKDSSCAAATCQAVRYLVWSSHVWCIGTLSLWLQVVITAFKLCARPFMSSHGTGFCLRRWICRGLLAWCEIVDRCIYWHAFAL